MSAVSAVSIHDRRWLWSGLLVLAGAGSLYLLSPGDGPVPAGDRPAPAVGVEPSGTRAEARMGVEREQVADPARPRLPPQFFQQHPPGSRVPMRVPFVARGIEVGPGLFVPPLNGVKVEDGIPAIGRDPRLPPPGPVVAKVVAADGQEYWEHQDGSYTSCTYSRVRTPDGPRRIVATQHGAVAGQRGVPGR